MPLAAGYLLPSTIAARPADFGRAHRPAVDDRGRGLRVAADGPAVPLAQPGVDPLPGAGAPPSAVVVVDGRPGREVVRQRAPLAARAQQVERRIGDPPRL